MLAHFVYVDGKIRSRNRPRTIFKRIFNHKRKDPVCLKITHAHAWTFYFLMHGTHKMASGLENRRVGCRGRAIQGLV